LKTVRGKVTAGGFRMKSIRIGCIKISDESLRSPGEGPEGKRNVAMSLSEHVLSSMYCQVVEKQFCIDLKRQKARIYSP
jgi:hypothetical protein